MLSHKAFRDGIFISRSASACYLVNRAALAGNRMSGCPAELSVDLRPLSQPRALHRPPRISCQHFYPLYGRFLVRSRYFKKVILKVTNRGLDILGAACCLNSHLCCILLSARFPHRYLCKAFCKPQVLLRFILDRILCSSIG